MSRFVFACIAITVLGATGCSNTNSSLFGTTRVPAPGTGAVAQPNSYYPGAGAVTPVTSPASTPANAVIGGNANLTSTTTGAATGTSIAMTGATSSGTVGTVTNPSGLQLGGIPVNDATQVMTPPTAGGTTTASADGVINVAQMPPSSGLNFIRRSSPTPSGTSTVTSPVTPTTNTGWKQR